MSDARLDSFLRALSALATYYADEPAASIIDVRLCAIETSDNLTAAYRRLVAPALQDEDLVASLPAAMRELLADRPEAA